MHILNYDEFIHIMHRNENHVHLDFLSFDKSYIRECLQMMSTTTGGRGDGVSKFDQSWNFLRGGRGGGFQSLCQP